MNLFVLLGSSLLWGAMLWAGAMLAQRYGQADGAARQIIWRLAAMLLIAPWIIAPVGVLMGMKGPAPAPITITTSAEPTMLASWGAGDAAQSARQMAAPVVGHPIPWAALLAAGLLAGWAIRLIAARRARAALGRILAGASPAGEGPARRSVQRWKTRLGLKSAPVLHMSRREPSRPSRMACGGR